MLAGSNAIKRDRRSSLKLWKRKLGLTKGAIPGLGQGRNINQITQSINSLRKRIVQTIKKTVIENRRRKKRGGK